MILKRSCYIIIKLFWIKTESFNSSFFCQVTVNLVTRLSFISDPDIFKLFWIQTDSFNRFYQFQILITLSYTELLQLIIPFSSCAEPSTHDFFKLQWNYSESWLKFRAKCCMHDCITFIQMNTNTVYISQIFEVSHE